MCSYIYGKAVIGRLFLVQVKRLLVCEGRELQVHERLLAGSTAGVIAQTAIYPMEVRSQGGMICPALSVGSQGNGGFQLRHQKISIIHLIKETGVVVQTEKLI